MKDCRLFFHFFVLMVFAALQGNASTLSTSHCENEEIGCFTCKPNPSPCLLDNWKLNADFFIWYASEQTSSNWANSLRLPSLKKAVFTPEGISFDWDFGFRIGLGRQMDSDQWDSLIYWTWYRTKAEKSIADVLPTIDTEFIGGFINSNISQSAKIQWSIVYNTVDWEFGRKFWIGNCFNLRPFLGLKVGSIHQTIHSQWNNFSLATLTFFPSTENLRNDFWGIGPACGLNTKWFLSRCSAGFFNLFGDFSGATLWGTWICEDIYKDPTPKDYFINMKNSHLGALMLRGLMGVGWDTYLMDGQYHLAGKVGYEMQFWLNQLKLPTFDQIRLHGALTLQGVTVSCGLDF